MGIPKGFPKSVGRVGSGFMAFHAFHTLSFPRPAFRSALLDKPDRHPAPCAAFAKTKIPAHWRKRRAIRTGYLAS